MPENELNQGDVISVVAPLVWRTADKLFKSVSWALLVVVLEYGRQRTGSVPLAVVANVATTVFVGALATQAMYLTARDPATLGIPSRYHVASRIVQAAVGLGFFLLLTSPALYLDEILAALARART